jgi:hypothetical protein
MAERKTRENDANVRAFLDAIPNERRRKDSLEVAKMMARISRRKPKMWGPSIVGFGKRQYRYASGREGEICKIGFAPRVQSLVFYLGKFDHRDEYRKQLGKHRVGSGGCIYVNKLEDVDLTVLEKMFDAAYFQE